MQVLFNKDLLKGKCLDMACGNGEDFIMLRQQRIYIDGYDKFNPIFKDDRLLKDTYDTVTCLYCFNTIPSIEEHKQQLELLKTMSNNIYIAIRSDGKAINYKTWRFISEYDGWITSNNSFQRFYTSNEMVERYFGSVTYIHNGKDFKLFKLHI